MNRNMRHAAEAPVYSRLPFFPVSGNRHLLRDEDGREFIDLYGGHAVALLGHNPETVVAAIQEESRKLLFYSNALPIAARDRFIGKLTQSAAPGCRRVFLVNSGTEANEQALALARRLTGRRRIVCLEGGFHGRSLAALAASGIPRYRELAECGGAGSEMLELTRICPFDDVDSLPRYVDDEVAAVILEPVQGLAGARALSQPFLEEVRRLCSRHGALLIFDEVQSGCGRCGAFTCAEAVGVVPDLLTLAKGLGSGLPIAAVLMNDEIADALSPGDLGSTFGGGPIPCAAAYATVSLLDKELFANVEQIERCIREGVASLPFVKQVHGRGALLGIEITGRAALLQEELFRRNYLTGTCLDPHTLRLLPPLNLPIAVARDFVDVLRSAASEQPTWSLSE